jgi:hypothetical protein
MAVKLSTKNAMAVSIYPKEANPLWGETSTITVAHTFKELFSAYILTTLPQSSIS